MVSPTSLAGGLTAAAALLILAPHVSALPAVPASAEVPSSVAPTVASQATATPAIEATPEATAAEISASAPAPEALTTAAPDIHARSPGQVRPVALQKTHIFDYYAAPAGYRGFGKNRGQDDWFSRKNPQEEMNKMRPNRFWQARKYTPYDQYDGGPLDKRGEPEPEAAPELPETVAEPVAEPEPEPGQKEEQKEEQEQQVSSPNVLSKRAGGGWVFDIPPFFTIGVEAHGPDYKDVYKYVTWDSPSEPGQFAKHRGRNWRRDAGEGEGEDVPAAEDETETTAAEPQEQQQVPPEAEADVNVNVNGIQLPYPVNTTTVDPSYGSPFVTLLVQADPTAAATPTAAAEAEAEVVVEGETEVTPTPTPVYI